MLRLGLGLLLLCSGTLAQRRRGGGKANAPLVTVRDRVTFLAIQRKCYEVSVENYEASNWCRILEKEMNELKACDELKSKASHSVSAYSRQQCDNLRQNRQYFKAIRNPEEKCRYAHGEYQELKCEMISRCKVLGQAGGKGKGKGKGKGMRNPQTAKFNQQTLAVCLAANPAGNRDPLKLDPEKELQRKAALEALKNRYLLVASGRRPTPVRPGAKGKGKGKGKGLRMGLVNNINAMKLAKRERDERQALAARRAEAAGREAARRREFEAIEAEQRRKEQAEAAAEDAELRAEERKRQRDMQELVDAREAENARIIAEHLAHKREQDAKRAEEEAIARRYEADKRAKIDAEEARLAAEEEEAARVGALEEARIRKQEAAMAAKREAEQAELDAQLAKEAREQEEYEQRLKDETARLQAKQAREMAEYEASKRAYAQALADYAREQEEYAREQAARENEQERDVYEAEQAIKQAELEEQRIQVELLNQRNKENQDALDRPVTQLPPDVVEAALAKKPETRVNPARRPTNTGQRRPVGVGPGGKRRFPGGKRRFPAGKRGKGFGKGGKFRRRPGGKGGKGGKFRAGGKGGKFRRRFPGGKFRGQRPSQ